MDQELTPEQQEILQTLTARGVTLRCPACQRSNLRLSTEFVQIGMTEAAREQVARYYPFVALGCPNCGFMQVHRTRVLGLT